MRFFAIGIAVLLFFGGCGYKTKSLKCESFNNIDNIPNNEVYMAHPTNP